MTLAELAHETLPRWKGIRGSGVPGIEPVAGIGPEVADGAELTQMVLLGRAVAVLPRSLTWPQHPGLVHVPVADAPGSALVLVWSQEDRRQLVADFVASAVEATEG
ncbi:LysR substrate-binding domain-containing protein [Streptomyces sp. NPDC005794]|uniref:LysR substrate-binding domain-containing protein n=1 Tax=Streptomyces sp. NPDC005794 TaxID=3364733 RepID=UPI0036B94723